MTNHGIVTTSDKPWIALSSLEKGARLRSLEAKRLMLGGETFTNAASRVGVDRKTLKKHIGRYLTKFQNRLIPAPDDFIETGMHFYDTSRGHISIITTNSDDRSLIAEYMAHAQKAMKTGDESILAKYKDIEVIDADGKKHRFATDLDRIYEIEDAMEDDEFLELYADSVE